ncbi:MAG: DEAD/DEAH box helicase, partial [Mycetocola sp.]
MPKNKKPAGGRPAKNFDPGYARKSGGPAGAATGSRSPGHRGFRPVEGDAPKKARWNADERAARRHSDEPREQRAPRDERYDRDAQAPRNSDRPSYTRGERAPRSNERPAYNRGENRPDRTERPAYNRGERTERPAYNRGENRPDRTERPAYNRGERTERPAYNRGENRPDRTERPAYNRGERPERGSYNRDDRGPRKDFGNDRPRRDAGEKNFYPNRDAKGNFTPEDDVVLERLEAQATLATDVEGVTFADLGLGGNIVAALAELGAASPFPIQAATIPDVIAGRDVLGRGRTGSGKTIAFGAPLVEKLMEN